MMSHHHPIQIIAILFFALAAVFKDASTAEPFDGHAIRSASITRTSTPSSHLNNSGKVTTITSGDTGSSPQPRRELTNEGIMALLSGPSPSSSTEYSQKLTRTVRKSEHVQQAKATVLSSSAAQTAPDGFDSGPLNDANTNEGVAGLPVTPSNDAEFKEYLQKQKMGRRLEYIQQQVMHTLHIRNPPHNVTTSLTKLPDVLVQKLMQSSSTLTATNDDVYSPPEYPEESRRRQVVLFPEEDSVNCVPGLKEDVICLKFKLSDDLLSAEISSAVIWVNKNHLAISADAAVQSQVNFFVCEMSRRNVRQPINKTYGIQEIVDKDGWYQIEIKDLVKTWQSNKEIKQRTIIIGCDVCNPSARSTLAIAEESENISPTETETKMSDNFNSENRDSTPKIRNHQFNISDNNCTDTFSLPISGNNEKILQKQNGAFLLLSTEPEKNTRWKRGVDCIPGQQECCREDFFVNFSELNDQYKMVYHPAKFNAYICRGNCYYHSFTDVPAPYAGVLAYLRNRYNIPTACCTPTKFSSLQVFYASDTSTVQQTFIPNIIVEGCGCV